MILLKVNPFFSNFETGLLVFLFIMICLLIFLHTRNKILAKMELKRKARIKIVEPVDTTMSNKANETFKN